jgi:CheY-like chemotaxis protein
MINRSVGHLLVVDDNRLNRLKLAKSLQQEGHSVSSRMTWFCWIS